MLLPSAARGWDAQQRHEHCANSARGDALGWQEVVAMVRLDIGVLTAEESCLSSDCSWHGKGQFMRSFLESGKSELECVKLPCWVGNLEESNWNSAQSSVGNAKVFLHTSISPEAL